MKIDGIEIGPVLFRDPGWILDLTYQPYNARATRRRLSVATIHGRCIDCPTFLRGYDSLTGDTRTFRVDRIKTLHAPDGDQTDDLEWLIGQMINHALGLPPNPRPMTFVLRRPLWIAVRWGAGRTQWRLVVVTSAAFGYRDRGLVVVIGYTWNDIEHQAEIGASASGWILVDWLDSETGDSFPDLIDWLGGGPGNTKPTP